MRAGRALSRGRGRRAAAAALQALDVQCVLLREPDPPPALLDALQARPALAALSVFLPGGSHSRELRQKI